jgi:hypothetical protein
VAQEGWGKEGRRRLTDEGRPRRGGLAVGKRRRQAGGELKTTGVVVVEQLDISGALEEVVAGRFGARGDRLR